MTEKRQHRETSIMEQDSEVKLSAAQKARIERNKQKALLLRQARLTSHPYTKDKKESGQKLKAPVKEVDTEAGFFFDEDDEVQETNSVKVKHPEELRRAVRGSLFKKDLGPHEHEFGSGIYDEEEDVYRKTCVTCGHVVTYEEM
ncbi:hypothetical protein KUTeg_017442 [Tegillarca granosa]|uniref:XPA C-terminal domain-containing protein n=1 Tax=Tegillarca granosa TaxID=220873 RepID=A0ABQ9EEU9_TEGGR|nr:hypothetical protein KUTeg_017442 [Tegillarca granosa]